MGPISTGLGEIYQYELKSSDGSYDATALRTIQDWNVRRQLLGVPGATEINSFGGKEKQYQVRLDPNKLQSYGLTLRDVYEPSPAITRTSAVLTSKKVRSSISCAESVWSKNQTTSRTSLSKRVRKAFRCTFAIWPRLFKEQPSARGR